MPRCQSDVHCVQPPGLLSVDTRLQCLVQVRCHCTFHWAFRTFLWLRCSDRRNQGRTFVYMYYTIVSSTFLELETGNPARLWTQKFWHFWLDEKWWLLLYATSNGLKTDWFVPLAHEFGEPSRVCCRWNILAASANWAWATHAASPNEATANQHVLHHVLDIW